MSELDRRKQQHIELCLKKENHTSKPNGFEKYDFEHCSLPEIDFNDIDISTQFCGKQLNCPIIISSITGGCTRGEEINHKLAGIAQKYKIGFAVGSQRAAIADKSLEHTFQVRKFAPDILLLANLGAVQLNYGFGIDECQRAIDMIEADALILHLNPLQEVFQPEGNTNFSGLLKKIENICKKLTVPVIIKEVGYGISAPVAEKLFEAGVYAIDVNGSGTISWCNVEAQRCNDYKRMRAASVFKNWGLTTAESLTKIYQNYKSSSLIAGGGIKTGLDIAKAIALGASVCSNATDFFEAILQSEQNAIDLIDALIFELKTTMFCVGAKDIQALKNTRINII